MDVVSSPAQPWGRCSPSAPPLLPCSRASAWKQVYCRGEGGVTCELLPASLPAFNFLDLAGAEDQHAVLEAAHLAGGGPGSRGGRLPVPGGRVGER